MKRLTLDEILNLLTPLNVEGEVKKDIEIDQITSDSREVKEGAIFVAVKGEKTDGHDFIYYAYNSGALVVVGEKEVVPPPGRIYIKVKNSRDAERKLLRFYYGYPDREMILVGVTGTNGKTTITYLFESIFREAGIGSGVIGTVNCRYCDRVIESKNTTPSFRDILRLLSEMRRCDVEAVAMEVSSHALAQKRVDGFFFDAAIFTNLSRDHLDYHGDMENYYKAKARLFKEVLAGSPKRKFAVVNFENEWGRRLIAEITDYPVYSYGLKEGDAKIGQMKVDNFQMELEIVVDGERHYIQTELFGDYNALNILAAFVTAKRLGISVDRIVEGIRSLKYVPGRLEKVYLPSGAIAFIDYAHTPDAIRNVLEAVKKYAKGRIITIFGAGGDRDPGKRKPMGRAAAELSDIVIVTSDNPRTEDPVRIIEMVIEGVKEVTEDYYMSPDRREAIIKGLEIAEKNDVVMILGKGHENYQIIGNEKIHFSDREEVEKFVELTK